MTLMKLKLVENKWNLERQRRQFQEEENKKLEHMQSRLVCQEEESGKCKNCVLCFIFMWSLESTEKPVATQLLYFFSYSDIDKRQKILL